MNPKLNIIFSTKTNRSFISIFTKNFGKLVTITLTLIIGALSMPKALAHGDDKPGPHGGAIQMPGPFHTELVVKSDKKIEIYLLDMDWANPTTESSKVELRHSLGKRSLNATCTADKDFFVCNFPSSINLTKGQFEVKATRNNITGNLAEYSLPIKKF